MIFQIFNSCIVISSLSVTVIVTWAYNSSTKNGAVLILLIGGIIGIMVLVCYVEKLELL